MMRAESRPGSLSGLTDDQLGTAAVSLVVSEAEWTPDVAPAVMDRISRDAVAYPEQFDRRPLPPAPEPLPVSSERTAKRTIGRIAVFIIIFVILVALIVFAATANAVAGDYALDGAARLPALFTEIS